MGILRIQNGHFLNTTWIPQLKITNTVSLISYSSDLCLIEAF